MNVIAFSNRYCKRSLRCYKIYFANPRSIWPEKSIDELTKNTGKTVTFNLLKFTECA